jgi:hypothetical protein
MSLVYRSALISLGLLTEVLCATLPAQAAAPEVQVVPPTVQQPTFVGDVLFPLKVPTADSSVATPSTGESSAIDSSVAPPSTGEPSATDSSVAEPPTDDSPVVVPKTTVPQADAPATLEAPVVPSQRATPLDEVKFITPVADAVLDTASIAVTLQFPTGREIELKANGRLVNEDLIGRTEEDSQSGLTTQTWYGINLQEGRNQLHAKIKNQAQTEVSVTVEVRGAPKQLKVSTVESYIPADGRSVATVKGQLLDAQGNLSNRDALVTLLTSAGKFVGADADVAQEGFQVKAQKGEFTAQLQSGLDAKTVQIDALIGELEAVTQLTFKTSLRPSIATGVVDIRLGVTGTNFYDRFRNFLPPSNNQDIQLDARAAIFATGRVGEWLFTGAINTERPLNETPDGRNGVLNDSQFSELPYPVYGDSSTLERTAPSRDRIYARIERTSPVTGAPPDYFMWGDYKTEEFSTPAQEFTALNRVLHGFKANYTFGNLQISALYANNVDGFQRDTIAPDGTRGYYFLSNRPVTPGTETIFLELEELNRPGTVVDAQTLLRGADYDIDYDRGAILFREPILRTDVAPDGRILVRKIIVTYQFENTSSDSHLIAGRLRYHISRELNHESWLGATYIRQSQSARTFELYGADALVNLGGTGRVVAEYAHSRNTADEYRGSISGSAYRLEASGQILKNLYGRAYFRAADTGFSNDATVSFVPGQRRYGIELKAKVSNSTSLNLSVDHEDNNGIAPQPITTLEDLLNPGFNPTPGEKVDNSLTTITAGVEQKIGKGTLNLNWVHRDRTDRIETNRYSGVSDQIQARFQTPLTSKLTLQALSEINIGGDDPLYGNHSMVALDWAAAPGVTVRVGQHLLSGGQYGPKLRAITSLDTIASYSLIKTNRLTTDISGRFSILGGQDGMIGQASVGLKNNWTILPGLRFDVSYEYVSANFLGGTAAGPQFIQPYAVGSGGSAIGLAEGHNLSVGLDYTDNPNWKASLRYDFRTGATGKNSVFTAAVSGKLTNALTVLANYQQASSSNQGLEKLGDTATLRFGLAYRDPNNDRFNALLRYEYRRNPSIIPEDLLDGGGTGVVDHTVAVEAIYAPDWRWELYGKVAFRNSSTDLAEDLKGTSSIGLGQLRATYRFNRSWDIVGEARFITQPSVGFTEIGAVAEVGYYLTPNLRLAAGYVFGNINDRDFNGSRSASGPYLGVTIKVNELFNGFGLQKKTPPQQQEAVINASQSTTKPLSKVLPEASDAPLGPQPEVVNEDTPDAQPAAATSGNIPVSQP